jgi:hypothetical protein
MKEEAAMALSKSDRSKCPAGGPKTTGFSADDMNDFHAPHQGIEDQKDILVAPVIGPSASAKPGVAQATALSTPHGGKKSGDGQLAYDNTQAQRQEQNDFVNVINVTNATPQANGPHASRKVLSASSETSRGSVFSGTRSQVPCGQDTPLSASHCTDGSREIDYGFGTPQRLPRKHQQKEMQANSSDSNFSELFAARGVGLSSSAALQNAVPCQAASTTATGMSGMGTMSQGATPMQSSVITDMGPPRAPPSFKSPGKDQNFMKKPSDLSLQSDNLPVMKRISNPTVVDDSNVQSEDTENQAPLPNASHRYRRTYLQKVSRTTVRDRSQTQWGLCDFDATPPDSGPNTPGSMSYRSRQIDEQKGMYQNLANSNAALEIRKWKVVEGTQGPMDHSVIGASDKSFDQTLDSSVSSYSRSSMGNSIGSIENMNQSIIIPPTFSGTDEDKGFGLDAFARQFISPGFSVYRVKRKAENAGLPPKLRVIRLNSKGNIGWADDMKQHMQRTVVQPGAALEYPVRELIQVR